MNRLESIMKKKLKIVLAILATVVIAVFALTWY